MSAQRRVRAASARDVLKLIYKLAMIATSLGLAALAYLAYVSSTAGTGDVLLSIVLGGLALYALLSIPKLDWQDERADVCRGIVDDMRTRFPIDIQFAGAGEAPRGPASPGSGQWPTGTGAPISVQFGEPEVHRVDAALVDEAKRMAREGRPIDDICRLIDPGHDRHDTFHQQALRRIVQAMIDQG
ncbi:MAG TPA: hypothetical protein VEA61_11860 [Allosphingosinicella sp.]|nr:hypothetical protein [Allosphingosinicella sp.]